MNRRVFFGFLAGAAALPLVNKLTLVQSVGAWAEAKIVAGQIVSVTIISAGSGYTSPPL